MSGGVLTEPQGSLETRHRQAPVRPPRRRGVNVGRTQIYQRSTDARALIQTGVDAFAFE